jgi:threonine dehydrogenase-like Zn-dependent dehydrogenase
VTGAGPIGLLAALIGVQQGLEVHVLDRVSTGSKPELVKRLGATYHATGVSKLEFEPDIIIECTGVGQVIAESIQKVGAGGIVCLTGVGRGSAATGVVTGDLAAGAVLRNNVIVGSVNANKRHWYKAGAILARADRKWLAGLITRTERPENFAQALERKPDDIKVVIQFSGV